ncbi:glycosyltransferase family 4 protein [Bradyrhizobium diazoefficiens]|uniref:glycosyltransferase family 4 protein n=1 Tax=Bradyrhizobium diazoefficiens TaxID=1355477 RepID=UPI00190D43D9|nr:glycosyltransferase family 4 protein [Bradyrhizobium diazoefficiens]QQO13541.1 glycosyltransferase family 4 protein [Bradyrhizobium diazoefficiens]
MTETALFVSQTAEKGGAELFMLDLVTHGPAGWNGGFFADGPMVQDLAAAGRKPIMLSGGSSVLTVRREASAFKLISVAGGVVTLARALARAAKDYDVVCANSQKALFVSALASRLARRPLVWVLHDIITDPAFSRNTRRAAVLFANLFAARVVANSRASAEAFVAAGGKADRVRIVYCGFDPAAHPQGSAEAGATLRRRFDLKDGPLVGLFGRLTPWKGQHVLLKALRSLPDVQALIVGSAMFGQDAYEAELRQMVRTEGLEGRVCFAGFQKDVAALMAGVDIVLHTSTHAEPFGRVVVEGMLAGRPVIATRGGGVNEIVTDGEDGLLVAPDDPVALAAAISRLLADPDLAVRLAAAGRISAARRFHIDKTCGDMRAVLAEVR